MIKKKIFNFFPLSISIVLFGYIYYKAEIVNNSLNSSYYINYYYFSYFLIVLSFIFIFLKKKIKIFFYVVSVSIIFSLYLFEAYFYFYAGKKYEKIRKIKIQEQGKSYDKRDKIQIFSDLQLIEKDKIVIRVGPSNYIKDDLKFLPLSGISGTKTIFCNENGYYSIIETDQFGFNNPKYEWNDNVETEYLLIGDSHVHGDCVNRPFDIGSQLRILSNKPVLNLGYGGNGPLTAYATLKEFYPKNVKKTIWFYTESNDLVQFKEEIKNPIIKKYFEDQSFIQNLKLKQNETNLKGLKTIENEIKLYSKNKTSKNLNFKYKLRNHLTLYTVRRLLIKEKLPFNDFKELLIKVKKFVKERNSELYFVYIPDYYRLKNNIYDNSNFYKIQEIVNDLNINFVDLATFFEKSTDPLSFFPFRIVGHYNEKGYKKIAEEIYRLTN